MWFHAIRDTSLLSLHVLYLLTGCAHACLTVAHEAVSTKTLTLTGLTLYLRNRQCFPLPERFIPLSSPEPRLLTLIDVRFAQTRAVIRLLTAAGKLIPFLMYFLHCKVNDCLVCTKLPRTDWTIHFSLRYYLYLAPVPSFSCPSSASGVNLLKSYSHVLISICLFIFHWKVDANRDDIN